MARILFERAGIGFCAVRGALVRRVQDRLADAGFSPGVLDGIYGNDTEQALRAWQQAWALPPTGRIDVETWAALVDADVPPVFERALQVTAAFEGHGFGRVAGNFDGAWLTWGVIGFTLRHGELDALLDGIRRDHPNVFSRAFGPLESELMRVLDGTADQKRAWADRISLGTQRYRVEPAWADAFRRLGETPEAQAAQLERAGRYWDIARADAARLGLTTELGLALCFDIAVQNGGVEAHEADRIRRRLAASPPTTEQDVRVVVANVVAEGSRPRYIEDVRRRKLTLATGMGTVHQARYAVRAWGLDEIPVATA